MILVDSPPTGGFIPLSRRHADDQQSVITIPCPPTHPDQVEKRSVPDLAPIRFRGISLLIFSTAAVNIASKMFEYVSIASFVDE
jgi:hypothetical protein